MQPLGMQVLPDLMRQGLTTVFCGSAASSASASTGAYYAGPGNRFWPTLSETGLTPHQFAPSEFQNLAALGIGLTDLAKFESGMDKDLSSAAYDTAALIEKIEIFTPSLLAFTAKRPAGIFMLSALGYDLKNYGEQAVHIGRTRIFVLPSPSGAARRWWSIKPWLTLANNHQLERDKR